MHVEGWAFHLLRHLYDIYIIFSSFQTESNAVNKIRIGTSIKKIFGRNFFDCAVKANTIIRVFFFGRGGSKSFLYHSFHLNQTRKNKNVMQRLVILLLLFYRPNCSKIKVSQHSNQRLFVECGGPLKGPFLFLH